MYKPQERRAVVLMSDGVQLSADSYEERPRGVVVAKWIQPKVSLETEALNVSLVDGVITKLEVKGEKCQKNASCERGPRRER